MPQKLLHHSTWLFGLLGCLLVALFNTTGGSTAAKAHNNFLFPPKDLPQFTFGYSENLADILWLRVIQDFDICDQSSKAPAPIGAPYENLSQPREKSRCDTGWVYHMIDAITELAPKFETAYLTGGQMLSILVDDRQGALKILTKGGEHFPQNWKMHYVLGYHYLYELKDLAKAADEIKKAAQSGAPDWTYALAGRLYSKSGQAALGVSILEDALQRQPEGPTADRIRVRLNELKKDLAKPE